MHAKNWSLASSSMPMILSCSDKGPSNVNKNPRLWMVFDRGKTPTKKKSFEFFFKMYEHLNFFFKSFQIYMRDPESAKSKEKSNFRFFRFFIFWDMVLFVRFTPIFDEFFTINRKIKIGEFFILHSFFSAHSTSVLKIGSKLRWGAGVCISLREKSA